MTKFKSFLEIFKGLLIVFKTDKKTFMKKLKPGLTPKHTANM